MIGRNHPQTVSRDEVATAMVLPDLDQGHQSPTTNRVADRHLS